jgi:hypothetical protein
MTDTKSAHKTTKTIGRRNLLLVLLMVVVLVIAALGIFAFLKLTSAKDDLDRATSDASQLQSALSAGNQAMARTELNQLQSNVHSAESTLDSFVLSAAAKVPVLGRNVKAVRTVTSAVITVADEGLPPLVEVADRFNARTFNPRNGRIDVKALAALTPSLSAAAKAMTSADAQIQAVDGSGLLSQVRRPVIDAQRKIGDASSIASRASTATRVVPRMLKGKHNYLLLFQNNAEIRATGGLPGAYAELKVNDGKITLGGQGAGADLGGLSKSATSITADEKELYTNNLVRDFRDVNFTPDFPRAAQIATAMLKQEKDLDFDGVVSLDPVTLSYLLEGTGPIDLEDGTQLTADNAVEVLLNGTYVNYPNPKKQDAFFANATDKVFDKVLSGAGDPTALLKSLTRATNERRVSVWAQSKAVTREIAGTPLANELPTGKNASPALGFYFNDATGAKMQYYLSYSIVGSSQKCSTAGVQTYRTETTLRSSAPADSATLPESIRGPGFGAQPGSMLMNISLYGPVGGKITSVSYDGKKTPFFPQSNHEGRPVGVITVQVNPGQTVKIGATVVSGKDQKGATKVLSTPSIVPGASAQTWKTSC